jgi:hypothetical protein
MTTLTRALIGAALCLVPTLRAPAHFVWVDCRENASGQREACVWFSEVPAPGEPHLVDRAAKTSLRLRDEHGTCHDIELREEVNDEDGGWIAPLEAKENFVLEGSCEYGVFDRGEKPLLLTYYGKHLHVSDSAVMPKLCRAESAALDVVPTREGDTCSVQVFWQSVPAANVPLVVLAPNGNESTLKTDGEGGAAFTIDQHGLYALRATFLNPDEKGTRDGKPYEAGMYISTLTLHLGGAAEVNSEGDGAESVLATARERRAVWHDFPGFTADVKITVDDECRSGRLTVSDAGQVKLDVERFAGIEWAERNLGSLVSHRMPGDAIGEGAIFLSQGSVHPLGPEVKLEGDGMGSVYRIKDHAVTEVNRDGEFGRFKISVLDVQRNEEGYYTPRVYAVTFWNADGQVRSTSSILNDWLRVDGFDLPAKVLEIESKDGESHARMIEFSNHRLCE